MRRSAILMKNLPCLVIWKKACTSCTAAEEQNTHGSWSQRTISRLLRSTFNPRMRWLFPGQSQDDCEEDEEEEEGNLVKAYNLVSRSSARLVHLQHALLSVATQWQHVGASPKVCIKGFPAEGKLHFVPSSPSLNKHYQALWRLMEQRSLLLFIHEYTRRAHLTAEYISKVSQLLEDHLSKSHLTSNQTPHLCSSARVHLSSLCQEFRIHLNHWSCLSAKVQADPHLRRALGQHNKLLGDIRQTLDSLGLQVLVLMERYVHAVLSAVAQADLDHIPREVLADILDSADLYSQVVEEQRIQHSVTKLRSHILQQTMSQRHHPTAVSVKDLLSILAVHHANAAANQLHRWTYQQCVCPSHTKQNSPPARFPSPATWEQLQDTFFISCSSPKTCHLYTPELHLEKERHFYQCQTCIHKTGPVQTHLECKSPVRNSQNVPMAAPTTSFSHLSTIPLFRLCQQDRSKVELLFHVLASSNNLLVPLVSHPSLAETTIQTFPCAETNGKADQKLASLNQSIKDCSKEGNDQEAVELEITTTLGVQHSSGAGQTGPEEAVGANVQTEHECARQPRSVQWLDLDRSLAFEDLLGHYHTLLWAHCSKALWLQMHVPQAGRRVGSINLHDNHRRFQVLQMISQASKTDLLPKKGKAMLEEFSLNMLFSTAHAQWDYVVCRSLGAALKDKCQTYINQRGRSLTPSFKRNESVMTSLTAENLLQLSPPLLSCVSYCSAAGSLTLFPSWNALCRGTMNLMLATVQLSTVWIMSKAYQFLSSWSLNKFLLITQGDLNVLRESLDTMVQQTTCLTMDSDDLSAHHVHNQLVLTQQRTKLDIAVSQLQTLSSLVLETFSNDCKRISADAFEQTMPPAGQWRLNHRPGFPSSPSEYASLAAQNIIGQVLEGVTSLSDDACIQALSVSTTAFMEAWMEHILKHKLKFSIQGALQLKQDFDSVRELICSDAYGLPEELLQRLLGLRVFQQVDSAVLCLLQQPHVKPYLHSTTWEPFTRCCATKHSRDSLNAAVGSSISNLRGMEGEDMTQAHPSVVTTDIPSVDPFIPGEPYLAPSLALGASQQEWLDLRIHNGCRRWRLPGLQCLSKSEP
ncbi:uncharacterized protein ccdc142 isoform X2 [Dunckerocampus dactyliophorus]|uniref:uncharacterized protein ccdc142 isoform X2 n=1 Tax=Dunckerocampus dactyliophorus TaxID=161453 RepID=UPI0024059023|nr:uncharacterized protein ccdc142 isoform X2 [Dunckerocampus dactyliophorus]